MSMLLYNTMQYYMNIGYKPIEVPYIVPKDISAITKPKECNDLEHINGDVYVGSGEQSFLHLLDKGLLKYGKYQCVTPCTRDENSLNDITYKMFLKLELIHILNESQIQYREVILAKLLDVVTFHKKMYLGDTINVIKTDIGFDIMSNDIEIGSYGIRKFNNFIYIYGTGLALPRFNVAMDMFNEMVNN